MEMALFGVLAAMTFGAKLVMSGLPNIEPVSLMIMLFAVVFGKKGLFPLYVYVAMEFLYFGFESSITRPPKAITLPETSIIGTITRFLNAS